MTHVYTYKLVFADALIERALIKKQCFSIKLHSINNFTSIDPMLLPYFAFFFFLLLDKFNFADLCTLLTRLAIQLKIQSTSGAYKNILVPSLMFDFGLFFSTCYRKRSFPRYKDFVAHWRFASKRINKNWQNSFITT